MIRLLLAISLVLATGMHAAADVDSTSHTDSVRAMTFNIRYGTANDGDNSWPLRKEMVFDVIRKAAPDVLGLQEALRGQLEELAAQFPEFAALGVGREADGTGEYSALLYRSSRFDVDASGTFWLSDTPDVPASTSWGNELPRICCWARLLDRETNQRLVVYNTHWDHQSQPAREGAGKLIAERITGSLSQSYPVIVMGDFNVGEGNPARSPLVATGLRDSYRDSLPDATEVGTFNGFKGRTKGQKIDAVLISDYWQVESAEIIRTNREGRYPSDHFPVSATLHHRSTP